MDAQPMGNVLIVDDNADFQLVTGDLARLSHCQVTQATSLLEARRIVTSERFDLMMIDLQLPDGNGLDLLEDIDVAEHGQIAIVTGHPSIETAARAVRSPVVEYLVKPLDSQVLTTLLEGAYLRAQMRASTHASALGAMIGKSPAMQDLFEHIRRVAPLDVSVLVRGESGTGKELVARAIHDLSGRKGRFVAVNCGAIATELVGSQLFGHERGSFTGAMQSHAGFFEQAEGGTLFLDEISEMPLQLQVYLLRVLESRSLTRIGGSREVPVDVRVVAATNCDPQAAVAAGTLRSDLYYRLLEFPLSVPSLSERRDDIPLLAQHFLDRLNERYQTKRSFAPDTLRQLMSRVWAGNVRELRHTIQRCYILARNDVLEPPAEQMFRTRANSDGSVHFRVGMTFDDIEREMLLKTLAYHGNNKRQAARALGITAKTIYNRLLRYRESGLISDAEVGEPELD